MNYVIPYIVTSKAAMTLLEQLQASIAHYQLIPKLDRLRAGEQASKQTCKPIEKFHLGQHQTDAPDSLANILQAEDRGAKLSP